MDAVRAQLLADATAGALLGARVVSGGWEGRVYQRRLPQTHTLPAIVVQRISNVDGLTQKERGLERVRLQLNCLASTPAGAESLARAVRNALHGSQWGTADGDLVLLVTHDNDRDAPDDPDADTAPGSPLFGVFSDYFVHFRKAA